MNWKLKIEQYCHAYNIPVEYLADTLNDPKVIPMIRGKAFEFSVMIMLNSILPQNIWRAEKPVLNPQLGSHDKDVILKHLPSGKSINIECKLAGKGRFTQTSNGTTKIAVKCMRSRTLGVEMVADLAPNRGVKPEVLSIHKTSICQMILILLLLHSAIPFTKPMHKAGLNGSRQRNRRSLYKN